MNKASLELAFPHVARGPCHDTISFREFILELAIVSASSADTVSGAMPKLVKSIGSQPYLSPDGYVIVPSPEMVSLHRKSPVKIRPWLSMDAVCLRLLCFVIDGGMGGIL